MNFSETRIWLDGAWNRVPETEPAERNSGIDRLVNSKVLSIRYALLTQIPGKIADQNRNVLCLQQGNGKSSRTWDARSFCTAVIVPWVADNHDVLGNSSDPYVNNPLRRPRLDEGTRQLRYKEEWGALVEFLAPLDNAGRIKFESAFISCLESVARRLSAQSFEYQISVRVSNPQLPRLIDEFPTEPSGGLRPLAVMSAMMSVLGRAFSLFSNVKSQGLNEADSSKSVPGDIMCYDAEGDLILAIEVKDRELTLTDLRVSIKKARSSIDPLRNLIFASIGIKGAEREVILESMETAWASGLNMGQIDILNLASVAFTPLPEDWRPAMLREIGMELDKRAVHSHRRSWHALLSNISFDGIS